MLPNETSSNKSLWKTFICIVLDSQIDKSKPEIHNLDYDELVLEETGEAKIEVLKLFDAPLWSSCPLLYQQSVGN